MAKNIVICCDGTGNQIDGDLSNVLKLFRILGKSPRQFAYYNPGVGTIGSRDAWSRFRQDIKEVVGLATGYGLDADIARAYEFVCTHYEEGDSVFLFGFSRGAYTVRAVAGLMHLIGLLPVHQLNLIGYALNAYKLSREKGRSLKNAWNFSRIVCDERRAPVHFLGAWDTVASVIVPWRHGFLPGLQTLPYTAGNPSVEVFRHAMSIDERRRMFRLNAWKTRDKNGNPQLYQPNPFQKSNKLQDIRQVWFAGVHSDIGGGYPECESELSKYPLGWMIGEATKFGLEINQNLFDHLVLGKPLKYGKVTYVAPDAETTTLHDSLTWKWKPLEWIPKSCKWQEWPDREKFSDSLYIPDGEPRVVATDDPAAKPLIHHSAVTRFNSPKTFYKPINFPGPGQFDIEKSFP